MSSFLFATQSIAHELRPVYLQLEEQTPGHYSVLLKLPALGDTKLDLTPEFSGDDLKVSAPVIRTTDAAEFQSWNMEIADLRGRTLRLRGLESTITDALVRVEFADGTFWVHRLTPEASTARIAGGQSPFELAGIYLRLGYEHILLGVDHLLFVLGLVLIVRGRMQLLKTITAFTIAHSLTLAIATLGFASAPPAPLNTAIALSILFLGPEIARTWRNEDSMTLRRPWMVAFVFGLLHGFGFASGLTTSGMSAAAVPQALLWFNVGVELGQLAFVALVLAILQSWKVLEIRWPIWCRRVPGYIVGVCGAFWTIQRTVAMFTGR